MSTGIPPKTTSKRKKIPVYLSYAGKESEETIITRTGKNFENVTPVNGSGDNLLFYGDNFDVLLYLLHNGYKRKITLIYIDPPFATASDYVNRCSVRGRICRVFAPTHYFDA